METITQSDSKVFKTFSQDDTVQLRLLDIKHALIKKGRITDEELPSVKVLIKDVIGYKDLPANIRNEFIEYISYEKKEKDELIIKKEDQLIDMYIILKGKVKISAFPPLEVHKELTERNEFDIISQISMFKTLNTCQTFGDFTCFSTEKCWKSNYAYAETDEVELLKIDCKKTKLLLEKQNNQQKHLDLLTFFAEAIPGFKFRTTLHKERIASYFETKVFNPGYHLIKEGEKSDYAYIVRKGECRIISYQIPIMIGQKIYIQSIFDFRNRKSVSQNKGNRILINSKGYFSKTTNSFQIGIISEKQWIADELLIFKDEPFPFSIVTQTIVEVLRISKQDLFTKLPKDILSLLESKGSQKLKWIKKRLVDIGQDIQNVSKWDNLQEGFNQKIFEIQRKYPKATNNVLQNFANKQPYNQNCNQFKQLEQLQQGDDNNQKTEIELSSQNEIIDVSKQKLSLTINLKALDYSRPKTAATTTNASPSYYGGFFNTYISFQNEIDKQSRLTSPQEVQQQVIPQKIQLMKRPSTQESFLGKDFLSSQRMQRPITATSCQQLEFPITLQKNLKNQISQSVASLQTCINPGVSIASTKQQQDLSINSKNLVQIPSIKTLSFQCLQKVKPNFLPLELASTFSISTSSKLSVPTFSKLQFKKQQNYENIQKKREDNFRVNKDKKQVLQGIFDEINQKHTSFSINGKCISVKPNFKRQDTPNQFSEWASENSYNLRQGGHPDVIKRKKQQMDKILKLQEKQENAQHLVKIMQKRMSKSLKRISSLSGNAFSSSSRKLF